MTCCWLLVPSLGITLQCTPVDAIFRFPSQFAKSPGILVPKLFQTLSNRLHKSLGREITPYRKPLKGTAYVSTFSTPDPVQIQDHCTYDGFWLHFQYFLQRFTVRKFNYLSDEELLYRLVGLDEMRVYLASSTADNSRYCIGDSVFVLGPLFVFPNCVFDFSWRSYHGVRYGQQWSSVNLTLLFETVLVMGCFLSVLSWLLGLCSRLLSVIVSFQCAVWCIEYNDGLSIFWQSNRRFHFMYCRANLVSIQGDYFESRWQFVFAYSNYYFRFLMLLFCVT